MKNFFLSSLSLVICLNVFIRVGAQKPLYTKSRWIVDGEGKRVKLACVNWPSHLETVLAEGLNKSPIYDICKNITANGFNCVRFTWPVALPTNDSLASTTIQNHFMGLGLDESIAGIQVQNPQFLNLTIIQAYQTVVSKLGENNVMVILDNHISVPGWCCSREDGNGFFGDKYFDPQLWLKGLDKMATLFSDTKNVVGMSLRNELRGPNQDATVWRKYMQEGAEIVHKANPDVLVILSGLSFDNDLGFLRGQQVNVSFTKKLVFEVHRYGVSIGDGWINGNPNDACGNFISTFMHNAGYLLDQGFPLFLSEFGGDQRGININDNRFLNCAFGVIADLDLDWALWSLQGSYYLRQGVKDLDEVYGVLNLNWSGIRNFTYMQRVKSIQAPFQGPGLYQDVAPYNIMYHPLSGFCIQYSSVTGVLKLAPCEQSNVWIYNAQQGTIMINGTSLCLQAVGLGMPVGLGTDCDSTASRWELVSASKMQLSSKLTDGNTRCLSIDSLTTGVIITTQCSCLQGDSKCDPAYQLFKIVTSRRKL
ncbi:cellulase [Ranunculus cassubicifolius]